MFVLVVLWVLVFRICLVACCLLAISVGCLLASWIIVLLRCCTCFMYSCDFALV